MNSEYDDILKAQVGDREAFGRIVERRQDLVYGVCFGMTAQVADAEDLAQEVFGEAFLKLHTLRDASRLVEVARSGVHPARASCLKL